MTSRSIPTITLNNGIAIPQIGYGVFQTPPQETERAVREALEVGYRHIDTAQAYRNEEGVGAAVAASGLPREEVFLTTKIWITNSGEERAARSIDDSLRRLGTDYIDLLLIHQPFGDYYGTYRAMEKALAAGKVRAIGVSNFFPDRFVDLVQHVEVPPAVNQMETHVFNQQADNRAWYAKYGTALESWGPLAQGRNNIFTHPVLSAVGEKHGKTAAQVALRYLIQLGIIVIPKTVHRERMVTNLDVTDFRLDDADLQAIAALDEGVPLTLITEAVFARSLSAMKEERVAASAELSGPKKTFAGDRAAFLSDLHDALYAAKIVSYAQGYALMRQAAHTYGWNLNNGGIALMWRGGCIIRSVFLGKIKEAFDRMPNLTNLLLDPFFKEKVLTAQSGWRSVVASAVTNGIPVPSMSAALSYFDGYRTERLPANLLQAQRDFFGAHTYERVDRERGTFFHTNWTGKGGDTSASTYTA